MSRVCQAFADCLRGVWLALTATKDTLQKRIDQERQIKARNNFGSDSRQKEVPMKEMRKVKNFKSSSSADYPVKIHPKRKCGSLQLDHDVIVGDGGCLGSESLVQDKAYWEVHIIKPGAVRVGLFHSQKGPKDLTFPSIVASTDCWTVLFGSSSRFQVIEGDVLGCIYDQSDLPVFKIFLNNELIETVSGMKGEVIPLFAICENAKIQIAFDPSCFHYNPPDGFSPIMVSRNIL
eukprot:GILI01036264.1.p1 GENE.GILI01036264.1~~GILI01036264.1.p1  ORF type:complete len:245 (+),score=7.91 GILI01036264.1:36-737(+)